MKYCPTCEREYQERLLYCPFDGERLLGKSAEDHFIGLVLDNKYRVEEKIGEGGMGKVYRGVHVQIDYPVAIKILHPELSADQLAIERFRREARAAAQIRHPNAVAVTDFGVTADGDVAYLIMEFLEGLDLRRRIKEAQRLDGPAAWRVIRQTCSALHAAHQKGIIHRDLKPDNIWLIRDEYGEEHVKVLDFGIAKLKSTTEMATLTREGMIVGTPYYMSPEQCRGEELDARSDVYSLGIIIYEMLTGQVPFRASTPVGVVIKHASERPAPLRDLRPDIPPAVEDVVLRALEKHRELRQESAPQLAHEFEAALRASGLLETSLPGTTQMAPPAPPPERRPRATSVLGSGPPTPIPDSGDSISPPVPGSGDFPARPATPAPDAGETRPLDDPGSYGMPPAAFPLAGAARAEEQAAPRPEARETSFAANSISPERIFLEEHSPFQGLFARLRSLAGALLRHYKVLIGVAAVVVILGAAYLIDRARPARQAAPAGEPPPPPGMVLVRGGTFKMGSVDPKGDFQSKAVFEKTVASFYLDINEVTNEEYEKFVREKGHPPPPHWKNGKYLPGTGRLPVVNVSWEDARAYAEYAGKRLPTEAEWEYAARGAEMRAYPWAGDWSPSAANLKEGGRTEPAAVGSYPDGRSWCGANDLAGNVAEWVADALTPYPNSGFKQNLSVRVYRGGSFKNSKDELLTTNRPYLFPGARQMDLGFRCARDLPR